MTTYSNTEELTQISLYRRENDGTITKTIKTIPGLGTPWTELLVDFADMLRALGYDIPLTYDDFMNLPYEYPHNDNK